MNQGAMLVLVIRVAKAAVAATANMQRDLIISERNLTIAEWALQVAMTIATKIVDKSLNGFFFRLARIFP